MWEGLGAARDLGRAYDISSILIRYGLGDIVRRIGLATALQRVGKVLPLTVVGLNDATVEVDANHPLAGKDLVFDIELVDIVEAA